MLKLFVHAIEQVLLFGLVLGAGLPALFAVGVRAMAYGTGGDAEVDTLARPHPLGRVIGLVCFALVAAAALLGIATIVASGFGYKTSFAHVYPTFVKKH